jgi:hypothetical protein
MRYIRLRCLTTGHQWDACESAAVAYLAAGGCEIARPPREASRPRPMKAFRDLAGRPVKPRPRNQGVTDHE